MALLGILYFGLAAFSRIPELGFLSFIYNSYLLVALELESMGIARTSAFNLYWPVILGFALGFIALFTLLSRRRR
jgi:hypothetical protein